MASGIYEIVNTVNGKRYVGSAYNIHKRWAEHRRDLGKSNHHNVALQRAWAKYGPELFEFRVLFNCIVRLDLIEYEQKFIDELKPAYNICRVAGSTLGVKPSAETRALLSRIHKGNKYCLGIKHSPEVRARMGAGKLGKKKGPMSAETRAKLSAAKTGHKGCVGRKVSEATRAKLVAANLGKKASIESRRRRSTLTDMQVREIRRLRSLGQTYTEVAANQGIKEREVARICLRLRYDWVDPDEPPLEISRKRRKKSAETLARMSAASKGRTLSPEAREKIAAAHRGRKHPPEFGAAISARNTGMARPKTPEHRRKISEALMGHHYNAGIPKSAEHRAKLSAAKLGVPNLKLRGSKGRTGQKQSREEIAKRSEALKASWAKRKAAGLVRNEEAIAKQAASMRASWAKRKAAHAEP